MNTPQNFTSSTSQSHDPILRKISELSDYAIELQRGLTSIAALGPANGGPGEWDKAEWLEAQLRKLPFDEITRIDAPEAAAKNGLRPNIIARYKGIDSSRTLWIMSHLDVVPPGEASQWKTPPFEMHIEKRKTKQGEQTLLYGRGVEDDQQGLVSSILCVRALMECGVRPPYDVALIFNADEETGSEMGAGYVTAHHPELFGKHDMFIVPDGGNAEGSMIEIAEKSILWLELRNTGKQCHASTPEKGRNSFKAACDLVMRLDGLHQKFNKKDALYSPPISTFTPTKKEGNVPNINTLPGEDVFYLDCRIMPCYKISAVMNEIKKHAKVIEKKYGVKYTFKMHQSAEAAPPTSPKAEIVSLMAAAIKKIHKTNAKPMGIGGGTVAAFFRKLGLPAVVYSRHEETAHQPNEYCVLEYLVGDAQVFAHVALNMGKPMTPFATAPKKKKAAKKATKPAKKAAKKTTSKKRK